MSLATQPNPHEVRVLARVQKYDNRAVEDQTIREVDEAVFERVRTHERELVEIAHEFLTDKKVHVEATHDIVTSMRDEVRVPLTKGALPTAAMADRYEQLRGYAELAISELERADEEAAWLAGRANDPYAAYIALMEKWPTVRPLLVY
ncbi:hypothetical protein [Microterricola pindariensis]|nr:hypothetical protein [Microterricola pindariensis]